MFLRTQPRQPLTAGVSFVHSARDSCFAFSRAMMMTIGQRFHVEMRRAIFPALRKLEEWSHDIVKHAAIGFILTRAEHAAVVDEVIEVGRRLTAVCAIAATITLAYFAWSGLTRR